MGSVGHSSCTLGCTRLSVGLGVLGIAERCYATAKVLCRESKFTEPFINSPLVIDILCFAQTAWPKLNAIC